MSAFDLGPTPQATFRTLAGPSRAEIKARGSRFIATARPVVDLESIRTAIESVRSEFEDATHHCWAYSLKAPGPSVEERCHDAGEPRGTAGAPILQAIRGASLCNVVVVVSRYFGGTKLGKGGLARAYREAATRALEGALTVAMVLSRRFAISVPLALDGEARSLVARHRGRVERALYDSPGRSVLHACVPVRELAPLRDDLLALARGDARLDDLDSAIDPKIDPAI